MWARSRLPAAGALLLLVVLVALIATVAAAEYTRRAHSPALPFVMGARYGRTPSLLPPLEPRTDRFFMGSRYGKRSKLAQAEPERAMPDAGDGPLLCRYTVVWGLIRCEATSHRQHYHQRISDESGADEEVLHNIHHERTFLPKF